MVICRSLGRVGAVGILTAGVVLGLAAELHAGILGVASRASVGGVSIDVDGVVSAPQVAQQRKLQDARQKALAGMPENLTQPVKLRKVSLRLLEDAIRTHHVGPTTSLPDDIKYLAGLQRVQFVFVYPQQQDIVLVGPAEGWRIDPLGNVVGQTTGCPVLLLDDLLVALRSGRTSAQTGISCSIDPTADGVMRVRKLTSRLRTIGNPQQTVRWIEEALGPQLVSINGVPASTHFARVMVAADFRMKRLAMNFDPAPVPNLPSYLHLLKATRRGMQNTLPRWWLAPQYEPLLTDAEGLSWELRGQGVQCMTEQDFVQQDGTRQGTGKAGAAAAKWAENMTAQFVELAVQDSAFGLLRNIMDLAVVAALIEKEDLLSRAELELPYLKNDGIAAMYAKPRRVASQASFLKKGRNYLISASGGVQIYPWEIADKKEVGTSLAPTRAQASPAGSQWWWN